MTQNCLGFNPVSHVWPPLPRAGLGPQATHLADWRPYGSLHHQLRTDPMSNIFAWLEGKKTYLVAFIAAALGLAQAIWPEFVLPEWVVWVLGALGLGAVRNALPTKPPE